MFSIAVGLVAAVLCGRGDAQDDGKPPAASRPAGDTDPFRPNDRLKRAIGGEPRDDEFVRLDQSPALPSMKLQGVCRMKGKQPAALIAVDGVGTYVVHDGERLNFSLRGRLVTPTSTASGAKGEEVLMQRQIPIALKILSVAPDGVQVEVGTLGQTLVIK